MDPEELDYAGEWPVEGSWGYQFALYFEVGQCTPIMCRPFEGEVPFEASGRFYQ